MGSSSNRQTTMAKLARERALQERRARKQQKKDERKQAALAQSLEADDDGPQADLRDAEIADG
jgi:hypothetical protein